MKYLRDKFGSIRFIVDGKNKNIYMFSASLLHNEAIMTLKLEYNSIDNVYGVSSETPPGKPLEASNNDDKQALRRLSKKYKTDWVWKYIKKPTYVKMDKTMSLEEK